MTPNVSIFPNEAQITLLRKYPKNFKVDIVENGFIVRIGCKELVFDSLPMLLNAIELYTEAPEEAEKKYCNSEDKYTVKIGLIKKEEAFR